MRAVLFGAMMLASAASAEPQRWYGILAENGALIGHASRETVTGPDTIQIIDSQSIDLTDEGDKRPQAPWFSARTSTEATARTVLTEDGAGRPIAISTESRMGPEWRKDWTRIEARIEGRAADITRTTPLETRHVTVALPARVRFDGGEGLLAALGPGESISFENFNVAAMAVERVVLEPRGETPGGAVILRRRYDGDQLLAVSKFVVGRDGAVVESVQPLFGASLTVRATDKATALAAHSPYRALPAAMTKSPYRISTTAMHGHIRYHFAFKDGLEFALPQTSEQRVTVEPGAVTVDICDGCGPGLATDAATLADARKATEWMQSDAQALKDIAAPVARMPVSDSRKMELLAQKVKSIMVRLDFTGHYSALETIARRSGDCTEASVLLAALGRAAGIPTRVANGLVYSREAYHGVADTFLPHSWTLAFADGKWRSFDSALDAFDSTHIAVTVGDGDARSLLASMQLAGLLQWQGFAEVRSPD